MNLHNKLTLSLLSGLLVIVLVSQVVQLSRSTSALQELSDENAALLEAREWQAAENICQSVEYAVAGSLERGEMEKFRRILAAQRRIQGLIDFSLHDAKGVATYSSSDARVGQSLPDELVAQFSESRERFTRRTDDAFEIYQPQIVAADCTRCHTAWTEGSICGTTAFRFSTAALEQANDSAVASMSGMRAETLLWTALTAGVIIVVFWVLAYVAVQRIVARPLRQVMADLSETSDDVHQVAMQVLDASQSLATGAGRQASSLEETSASLHEVAAMARSGSETAQHVKEAADHTLSAGTSGTGEMTAMSSAIADIKAAGDDVAKIVKTIDEIAFQTNILALNAAVEAARAGETGAGFAVVADEVRNLAQRSAIAARETADKIERSVAKSTQGVQICSRVAQQLEDIVGKAGQVNELASQIAAGSHEQSLGIEQISATVVDLDQLTQSNAAAAEQSAGAATRLSAQAGALRSEVDKLRQLIDGRRRKQPGLRGRPDHEPGGTVVAKRTGPNDTRTPHPSATRAGRGRTLVTID